MNNQSPHFTPEFLEQAKCIKEFIDKMSINDKNHNTIQNIDNSDDNNPKPIQHNHNSNIHNNFTNANSNALNNQNNRPFNQNINVNSNELSYMFERTNASLELLKDQQSRQYVFLSA
jgi:hypothetical protein